MSIIRDTEQSNQPDASIEVPDIRMSVEGIPQTLPTPALAPTPTTPPVSDTPMPPSIDVGGLPSAPVSEDFVADQVIDVTQQEPEQQQVGILEDIINQPLPKPIDPILPKPIPLAGVQVNQADSLGAAIAEAETQVQQSIDRTRVAAPLPNDLVLPYHYQGDLTPYIQQLNELGQFQAQIGATQTAQRKYEQAVSKAVAEQQFTQGQRNPWLEFAFGQGTDPNKRPEFNPLAGKFGDYGGGAVGAVFGALNYLPPVLLTRVLLASGLEARDAWNAAWQSGNITQGDWIGRFRKNLSRLGPDAQYAQTQTGLERARAQSYLVGAITGRDFSFSNWSTDKYGRQNPLGFLYGDQKQNEGKVDYLKGTAAFALDVFVDPGGKLLKLAKRGRGFLGLGKQLDTPAEKAAKEAAEAGAKVAKETAQKQRVAYEKMRDMFVGLRREAADPLRNEARPLANNAGVMQRGSAGSASVTPAQAYKDYLLRRKRPALPPARDTGNTIEASFSVVSQAPGAQAVSVAPPVPTIRSSAEAIINGVPAEEVSRVFKELDGREFPSALVQEAIDDYTQKMAAAKSPRGEARAYNTFQSRVSKLEKEFNRRVGQSADVSELPARPSSVSEASVELSRDYYLKGVEEPPIRLLPPVGGTGRAKKAARISGEAAADLGLPGGGVMRPVTTGSIGDTLRAARQKRLPPVGDTGRGQRLARLVSSVTPADTQRVIDEGVREFRRTEAMPLLMPTPDDYVPYTVQKYATVEMPRKRVFKAKLDDSDVELETYDTPPVLAVIDSDGRGVALQAQPLVDTRIRPPVLEPRPKQLGDAIILPDSVARAERAVEYYDIVADSIDESVLSRLDSESRKAALDLVAGQKLTTDGVILWDTGDVRAITTQRGGKLYIDPRAIPAEYFMPQASAGDTVQKLLAGVTVDVPRLSPRSMDELNRIAGFLPAPDGLSLVTKKHDTYEGLMSEVSRRLYGSSDEVTQAYFDTLRRIGIKLSDSSVLMDDTEAVLIEVMRGTSQNPQGTAVVRRALKPAEDLPKALNDGRPIDEQVVDAIQQGLDPEDLLDDLAEPDLADPKIQAAILDNTPDDLVGTSLEAQERAVRRAVDTREVNYLADTRHALEGQRAAVEQTLEAVVEELDKLPDLAPQVLTEAVPFTPRIVSDEAGTTLEQLFKEADERFAQYTDNVLDMAAVKQANADVDAILSPVSQKLSSDERVVSLSDRANRRWFHGTRVDDLDLSQADWTQGAARGEFGAGIYLTKNPEMADSFAKADVAYNLPLVSGRSFSVPRVHTVSTEGMRFLKADTPANDNFIDLVFQSFDTVMTPNSPVHKDVRSRLLKATSGRKLSIGKVYDLMSSVSAKAREAVQGVAQVDEKLVLNWQREVNSRLRAAGVDGIEHGDVVAVFSNERLVTRGVRELADEDTPLAVAVARYNGVALAAANYPKSKMLDVTRKEMAARVMSRLADSMKQGVDEIDEAIIRKLDDMTRGDEELRKAAAKEKAVLESEVLRSNAAKDDQTIAQLSKYSDSPCV